MYRARRLEAHQRVHQEDENVPRTLKAHPAEVDLLALALGRDGDARHGTRSHLAGCATCARREAALKTLADAVALETELAEEVERAKPHPDSPRSFARRARLAHLASESDAALREADALLELARDADSNLGALVGERIGSPAGRLALLYAIQRGNFVSGLPQRALALSNAILEAVSGAGHVPGGTPSTALLGAEARAVVSHALLNIGQLAEARDAARAARLELAAAGGDTFSLAVCAYFEASVMSFQGEFGAAESLFRAAARVFADHAQDHWVGRAEGMLGVLLVQRGLHERALAAFDTAVENLDPERDANAFAAALLSRGRCLGILARFEAARQAFAQALQVARHHRLDAVVFGVRQNLAELDLLRGDLTKALASYAAVALEADRLGLEEDQIVTRLAGAECLGRLGRLDEMIDALREIGRRVAVTDLAGNPAWIELASRLDPGDVDVGLVSEVRRHLEASLGGFILPFRAARRA
jgi:tetratricopeptide (TPR) repeat protein